MKDKFDKIRFLVGPMSKNIVDATIEFANENNSFETCFIPSRRQIECSSLGAGYVNSWSTTDFIKYVRKNSNVFIQRDHSGPCQGNKVDDGKESLLHDAKNKIDLIHIDPWKQHYDIESASNATVDLITFCHNINDNIFYEIGTEEAIRKYSTEELAKFLSNVKLKLPNSLFEKIVYCVVQSGTNVMGLSNTGKFNKKQSFDMSNICHDFGLRVKEHNSDYLAIDDIQERMNCGVDAFNIAPEFGVIETQTILDLLRHHQLLDDLDLFVETCVSSNKWKKWTTKKENKITLSILSGHYNFTNNNIIQIKERLDQVCFIDSEIKCKIKDKLRKLNCIKK